MAELIFLVIYWSLLIIPGAALAKIVDKETSLGPLSWIALSYIIFVLTFITFNYFQLPASAFAWLIFAITLSSSLVLISTLHTSSRDDTLWKIPSLGILVLSGLYQILIGSFNEVPSDLYTHLENFQRASTKLAENSLGANLTWIQIFKQKSGVFYYLVSFANQVSKCDTRSLIELVDFSNRTLFLIAVFCFTKTLFKYQKDNNAVACLAIIFISLHMGISVFAYIRYYSFAPTMLAMVIYFFALSIFLTHLRSRASFKSIVVKSSLLICALAATAAVHTQEAMFITISVFSVSLLAMFSRLLRFSGPHLYNAGHTTLITSVGVLFFTAIYLYSADNLIRAPNAHWRLWEFGQSFWFFPQITTLNLKFQFIQVVTLWGVLVYLLFFINIKRYRNNLFVLAGMLTPLITFLNPFFIDTFLRHYNSTTVWRLCYLLPIHFVAADLFVHYAKQLYNAFNFKKGVSLLVLSSLILLLTPINNTWRGLHFSRAPTLITSDTNLGYKHYNDLLDFLSTLPNPETVLTDPMLGYMVSSLSKHYSERRKFFRNDKFKRFSFYNYDDNPLDRYTNHLLIINRRTKSDSNIGALSGHWRKNEWPETEHYYPEALLQHVSSRPSVFEPLWSNNEVSVFRIN